MYLLSTFNKKVFGWGEILCFMYVFVMPIYASNSCILQKICNSAPWGHTFRWVAEFGVTPHSNSNGYSVQVLLAPFTVFFRLDEVKTCKQKNGNSYYVEVAVKNLLPSQIAFVTFYNLSRAFIFILFFLLPFTTARNRGKVSFILDVGYSTHSKNLFSTGYDVRICV